MSKYLVLILISLFLLSFDLPKSASRKIDKTLGSIWPEQNVVSSPLNISKPQLEKLSFNPSDNFYQIKNANNNTVAYMCLSKAKSKIMTFDYMVVFKSDLSILKVKMLIYREEYGGEIGSTRWLKQFNGKSDPNKLKFGHDVQNISGATISARSMTHDVRKKVEQIVELKKLGVI